MGVEGLDYIFNPSSVAVIGASERRGSIGSAIMRNLLSSFKGTIVPINVKYDNVYGLKCYKSILNAPTSVDLAVVAVPARAVLSVIEECGVKGVKGAIVISAGFREVGDEGRKLEEELVRIARRFNIRIIGPNCLGVYNPHVGLDTIFNPSDRQLKPSPGSVAFISQSGALGAAMLDWIAASGVGVSKFVSYGNAADVDESDLIEYLADDPQTKVIACYVEGVRDGRKFMRAVRRASEKKPVVVLKAGRTRHGVEAVVSHTGSLAGSYEVFKGAMAQCGAVMVNGLRELLHACKVLSAYSPPRGDNVAVITNGGGAGVLAVDMIALEGLKVARLSSRTVTELAKVLPAAASTRNPVDVLGDAPAERYSRALDVVLGDESVDMVMVIAIMQSPALDPRGLLATLKDAKTRYDKPIVLVAPGGEYTRVNAGLIEKSTGIPVFETPSEAVKALRCLVDYGRVRRRLSRVER